MTQMWKLAGILCLTGAVLAAKGQLTNCYTCVDMQDPYDCQNSTQCKPGDACVTHEKLTDQGNRLYDMGCLPGIVCKSIGFRHANQKRLEMCRGCCHGDMCNNRICSAKLANANKPSTSTATSTAKSTTTTRTTSMTTSAATTKPSTSATTATAKSTTVSPGASLPPHRYDSYHLLIEPQQQNVTIGSTALFDCKFDKNMTDSMTVSWFFIHAATRVKIHATFEHVTMSDLFISNVSANDTGTYECEVKLGAHVWTAKGNLAVHP